jgi:hypothetical protein
VSGFEGLLFGFGLALGLTHRPAAAVRAARRLAREAPGA